MQIAAVTLTKDGGANGLSLVDSVINNPVTDAERTWMADIEPLTLLIHAIGRAFVGSLIDRRWRCSIELPVESELESAERAALQYAEQYMQLHLGEQSWVLPGTVQWDEFVAIRSSDDLQRRISKQTPARDAPQLTSLELPKRCPTEPMPASKKPYLLSVQEPSRPALFLNLNEAASYTGLSEAFLKRKIHSGELRAIKDRGWKLRRADLRNI